MHKRCNLYSISSMRKAALFIIFERTRKKGPPKKEHKNNRTQKQSHSICRTNRTHRTTTTKAHQHFPSMFICVFTIWTYSKAERDKKKQREITGMQISACVFHRFTLAVAVYFCFVLSSKFLGHSVMKKKILSIYSLHNREVCRAHRIWYVQTFAQAFWLWCYIERSPPFFLKNIVSFYSCTILLESKNKKLHVKQQLHFSKQTTRYSAHCFFPFIIATSVSFADLISVHLVNALSSHII